MRRVRAFLFLAETLLKQKSFLVFLVIIVLIGPVFVVLHSGTDLAEREMRPLLSESATVDHFKIGRGTPMAYANEETLLLFRSPDSESAPDFPISPAFVASQQLLSPASRIGHSTWSFPINGSLSDVYRNLLPILMIVAGIMAFPSRRKLALLRVLLPNGRWSCFLMIAGVLTLQIILIGLLSGASTGLALALTQGAASGTIWFIGQYYGAIIVYALGFALIGFVIAELVRNRTVALLIGLVFAIGILPFASLSQAKLYIASLQWYSAPSVSGATGNPLLLVGISVLAPPETALDGLVWKIQSLGSGVEDPYGRDAHLRYQRALNWGSLAAFMGFWFAISWCAFPRSDRTAS